MSSLRGCVKAAGDIESRAVGCRLKESTHDMGLTAKFVSGAALGIALCSIPLALTAATVGPDNAAFVMTDMSPGSFGAANTEWRIGESEFGATTIRLDRFDTALRIGAYNQPTGCGAATGWSCGAGHVAWGEAAWDDRVWHFDLVYGATTNSPTAINDQLCLKDRSLPGWLQYLSGDGCVSIEEGRWGSFKIGLAPVTDTLAETEEGFTPPPGATPRPTTVPETEPVPAPVPLPLPAVMLMGALASLIGLRRMRA